MSGLFGNNAGSGGVGDRTELISRGFSGLPTGTTPASEATAVVRLIGAPQLIPSLSVESLFPSSAASAFNLDTSDFFFRPRLLLGEAAAVEAATAVTAAGLVGWPLAADERAAGLGAGLYISSSSLCDFSS